MEPIPNPVGFSLCLSRIQLFSHSDLSRLLKIPDYRNSLDEPVPARFNSVSAGYLETAGMMILEGRSIQEQDGEGALPVAVINQSMGRKYFPQGSSVGPHDASFWVDGRPTRMCI